MAKQKSPLTLKISLLKEKAVEVLRRAEALGVQGLPKSGAISLLPLKEVSLEISLDEGSFDAVTFMALSYYGIIESTKAVVENMKVPSVWHPLITGCPTPTWWGGNRTAPWSHPRGLSGLRRPDSTESQRA